MAVTRQLPVVASCLLQASDVMLSEQALLAMAMHGLLTATTIEGFGACRLLLPLPLPVVAAVAATAAAAAAAVYH